MEYFLSEEEVSKSEKEVLEEFKFFMTDYSDKISFDKEEDKDYVLYKENGVWTLRCGKDDYTKKFTNAYSLCTYVAMRLDGDLLFKFMSCPCVRVPIGTKVVVVRYSSASLTSEDALVGIGTIVDCFSNTSYEIRLDDNQPIIASKGKNNFYGPYFMTMEEAIMKLSDGSSKKCHQILDEIEEYIGGLGENGTTIRP